MIDIDEIEARLAADDMAMHVPHIAALIAEVRRLEAENARLREALPSEDERFNLGMALDSRRDAFSLVRPWLARLDAARKGGA